MKNRKTGAKVQALLLGLPSREGIVGPCDEPKIASENERELILRNREHNLQESESSAWYIFLFSGFFVSVIRIAGFWPHVPSCLYARAASRLAPFWTCSGPSMILPRSNVVGQVFVNGRWPKEKMPKSTRTTKKRMKGNGKLAIECRRGAKTTLSVVISGSACVNKTNA